MSPRRRLPRFALWEAGSRSAAAGLGDPAPVRNPVLVFTIRQARPEDDTILGLVDAATWSDGASPSPAPPAGTAFFADRTRPDDVLVAEVDGVVVGYAILAQPIALPSHDHVLELRGLAVDLHQQRNGAGRGLVEAAVEEARDRGARKLTLRASVAIPGPVSCTTAAASSSRAFCERSSS